MTLGNASLDAPPSAASLGLRHAGWPLAPGRPSLARRARGLAQRRRRHARRHPARRPRHQRRPGRPASRVPGSRPRPHRHHPDAAHARGRHRRRHDGDRSRRRLADRGDAAPPAAGRRSRRSRRPSRAALAPLRPGPRRGQHRLGQWRRRRCSWSPTPTGEIKIARSRLRPAHRCASRPWSPSPAAAAWR